LRQAIEKAEKKEPKKWVEVECPLCGEMAVAHTHPNLNKEKNK
jgi:formylmethanofuran dehydrogenase subunit E